MNTNSSKKHFLFYDLETTGLKPTSQRIIQFGCILTDEDFVEIKRFETYVKLDKEILPDPEAILITGISPLEANSKGITELQLVEKLEQDFINADIPNTTILGFNNIRFDDEFMRNLFWRNFRDPYEWQWKNGNSRWDLINLIWMLRALRPDGINWPNSEEKKPTIKLELLTKANNIPHLNAHSALADVVATIEILKLIKKEQPRFLSYQFSLRTKKEVAKILDLEQRAPFIHSSGKIGSNYLCTGVMFPIAPNPNKNDSILAFDLKFDPRPYFKKTSAELKELFYTNSSKLFSIGERNIPVKAIDFGKCPALAPIDVLDKQAEERIGVNKQTIQKNLELLLSGGSSFIQNIYQAYKTEEGTFKTPTDSEFRIYDGFLNDSDRLKCQKITKLEPDQLVDKNFDFTDERLNQLLIAYKARNWPEILNEDEARYWQNYISERISYGRSGQLSQPEFSKKIKYLKTIYSKDTDKIKLLNDLESLI